jgi:hypothetical protein
VQLFEDTDDSILFMWAHIIHCESLRLCDSQADSYVSAELYHSYGSSIWEHASMEEHCFLIVYDLVM